MPRLPEVPLVPEGAAASAAAPRRRRRPPPRSGGGDDAAARPLPPPPITSAGISSRPEGVQVLAGPDAARGLSEAQIDELFAAIAAMRKAAKATEVVKHGWTLQWKVRQNQGGSTRGDMCIIDPRDGQEDLQHRRPEAEDGAARRRAAAAGDAPPARGRRRDDRPPARRAVGRLDRGAVEPRPEVAPRPRRQAKLCRGVGETRGPRMPEQVLAALQRIDPDGANGASFAALALEIGTAQQQRRQRLEEGGRRRSNAAHCAHRHAAHSGRLRRRLAATPPRAPRRHGVGAARAGALELAGRARRRRAVESRGRGEGRRRVAHPRVEGAHAVVSAALPPAALVGRRVEIWWAGDGRFHPATVVRYCRRDGEGGADCARGTFVVEYEGTIACAPIEPLEIGDQEPQQWRLDAADADDAEAAAAADAPAAGDDAPAADAAAPSAAAAAAAEDDCDSDDSRSTSGRRRYSAERRRGRGRGGRGRGGRARGGAFARTTAPPTTAEAARRRRRRRRAREPAARRRRRRARARRPTATATDGDGRLAKNSSRASRRWCRSLCARSSGTITTRDASTTSRRRPAGRRRPSRAASARSAGRSGWWVQYDSDGSIPRSLRCARRSRRRSSLRRRAPTATAKAVRRRRRRQLRLARLCAGQWELRPQGGAAAGGAAVARRAHRRRRSRRGCRRSSQGAPGVTYCVRNRYFKGEARSSSAAAARRRPTTTRRRRSSATSRWSDRRTSRATTSCSASSASHRRVEGLCSWLPAVCGLCPPRIQFY